MKLEDKLRWFVVVLMITALLMVVATRTQADEGHGHHDDGGAATVTSSTDIINDLAGGDVIGGDTSVITGNNKSYVVVPPGLGDVDIAQCLGSEAWTLLVGGKQKLVLNQVCMAEFYLKAGRYDLAAQSLCNQPEILTEYDTESACELAHDFTPAVPDHDVHSRSDEFEQAYAIQEEEIVVVQMAQSNLEQRIEVLEQKPAPRPRVTSAPPPEKYTDDQFDAVWAALKGGDEDEQ